MTGIRATTTLLSFSVFFIFLVYGLAQKRSKHNFPEFSMSSDCLFLINSLKKDFKCIKWGKLCGCYMVSFLLIYNILWNTINTPVIYIFFSAYILMSPSWSKWEVARCSVVLPCGHPLLKIVQIGLLIIVTWHAAFFTHGPIFNHQTNLRYVG